MPILHKRILSALLLILFSWLVTPKELWHVFTHHEDSRHTDTGHRLQFTKAHHHCSLLQADQQFIAAGVEIPQYDLAKVLPPAVSKPESKYEAPLLLSIRTQHSLRGPPAPFV